MAKKQATTELHADSSVLNPESPKKWYQRVPNAMIIIFGILVLMAFMTWLVPSGQFDRQMMPNGREGVVAGSYHVIEKTDAMRASLFDVFRAIPTGMVAAGSVMMIVFLAGGMFKVLEKTGAIENGIGIAVRKIEEKKISKYVGLALVMALFGFFGAAVGFENLIGFVPVGLMVVLGLGFDLMVAASGVIGALAVGFATSPINAYTVGVAHEIADLPTFSGMGLRTVYCLASLTILFLYTAGYAKKVQKNPNKSLVKGISTQGLQLDKDNLHKYKLDKRGVLILVLFVSFIGVIIYGVLVHKWYLTEIAALFVLYAIIFAIVGGFNGNSFIETFMEGASSVTAGALIVGFARAIQVIMDQGRISDTIINTLSAPLVNFSPAISAVAMSVVQGVFNFFIPSGSGQAMVTMPIIVPLSDLINVNRQIAVSAFQIGDGLTNMIVPTAGTMLAMLAMAKVPYEKWLRFVFGLLAMLYVLGWGFLVFATAINWQ